MELDRLLFCVQKPARYIGGEWNSIKPNYDAFNSQTKICLCFPDLYEIGTSSLGFEILYRAVNSHSDRFIAERCYAPDIDFEGVLRTQGIRLFSVESKIPLKDFDLLGFTLQHELSLPDVLAMLELSDIEIFSKDRKDFPLIIGGGPLTANPEPFADFFDLFVVGDGEEVIIEILDVVSKAKSTGASKYDILKELSKLKGVYVPSFYEPVYVDGIFMHLKKNETVAPEFVEKRIFDLTKKDITWDISPIIPNIESVHSRLSIEIARGCPHRCRFCQAKNYYWPYRFRAYSVLKEAVRVGLKNTGYDEFAFTSLSSGDYPNIEKLIDEILEENKDYPLSVSLPSLHCESFSKDLATALSKSSSRPSLTFAPEAGSERLRSLIGKPLTDEAIFSSISNAVLNGWKSIKLYFMYGLPGETQQDLEAIVGLISEIKKRFRGVEIKLTLSAFVPKPQTDFERVPQDTLESLKKKSEYLRRRLKALLGGSLKRLHSVEMTFVEGVIARADRRMARVIFNAYKNGCRFQQWQDRFSFANWLKAFEKEDIDPCKYINRFSDNCRLPWEHIRLKSAFVKDTDLETPVTVQSCGRNNNKTGILRVIPTQLDKRVGAVRYRFRVSRSSLARYISHKDQIDMFRRAVRRAELPVRYSEGFTPQPKISFGPAISVGYESDAEYFEAEFSRYESPEKILSKIARQMPEGFKVLSVKQVPSVFPSLETLCNVVDYLVTLPSGILAEEVVERFNSAKDLIYQKQISGQVYDLRSVIREFKTFSDNSIYISQFLIPGKSIKPERLIAFLLSSPPFSGTTQQMQPDFHSTPSQVDEIKGVFLVKRLKLYTTKRDGTLLEL